MSSKCGCQGFSRRDLFSHLSRGIGAWALLDLLERDGRTDLLAGEHPSIVNPLAAKPPHFAAKAKSVIFLMMAGGPSQMETFDPKPELNKLAGQKMPESFGKIPAQFTDVTRQPLLACKLKFKELRPVGHSNFRGVSSFAGTCR